MSNQAIPVYGYRPTTDEIRARLQLLIPPQSPVEQILFIEAMTNIEHANRIRRELRGIYEVDPLAPASGYYEAIASHDGIADGVLFSLEVMRGKR